MFPDFKFDEDKDAGIGVTCEEVDSNTNSYNTEWQRVKEVGAFHPGDDVPFGGMNIDGSKKTFSLMVM